MKNKKIIKTAVGVMSLVLALSIAPAQNVWAEEAQSQETVLDEGLLMIPDTSKLTMQELAEFDQMHEDEMALVISKGATRRVWKTVNRYEYNADGSVKEHMDYLFDTAGNMTGYKSYVGDVLEYDYQYTLDASGNRISSASTYYDINTGEVEGEYLYTYDADGNTLNYTSTYYYEDGSVSRSRNEYTYDANGKRTKSVRYYNEELAGTVVYIYDGTKEIKEEEYDEEGTLTYTTEYIYEGENCVLENHYSHYSGSARLYSYTKNTYDGYGNDTETARYTVAYDGTENLSSRTVRTYVQVGQHFYTASYFSYNRENVITYGYAYERSENGAITKEINYTNGGAVESYTVYGDISFPSGAEAGAQAQERDDTYDPNNNLISYTINTYQLFVTGTPDEVGDTSLNGLAAAADGNWYYYVNGAVNTGYTGLVYDANVGWWYVENGKINFGYNGLILYGDAWWCVAGGQVRFDYTGLWCDPYVGWWYVNGGAVDFGAYGLVANEYGWWYVNGGAIDFGYTGLAYDANVGWWYVNGGAIDFGACGLVQYGDGWYYVNGGMLDWGYTGLAYDANVGWWYVNGGAIDFGACGLVQYGDNWYYVNGGMLDWGYTGTVDANGGTYNVVNGVVVF